MRSRYKILVIIALLLILLSLMLSLVNYNAIFKLTQTQLKEQSLPLSLDNIYTDIQKHIIEPHMVSSLMANDTFVKAWLKKGENKPEQIHEYLAAIKKKYHFFSTFLVSAQSLNYYSHKGFLEKLSPIRSTNRWYFTFKKAHKESEINLDYNEKLASDALMMFINYKIFDKKHRLLGVTGVAYKIDYINAMLKHFKSRYHLDVTLFDKKGEIALGLKSQEKTIKHHLKALTGKEKSVISYQERGKQYMLTSKYIPELGLFISVNAELAYFTHSVLSSFYLSFVIALAITLIILWLMSVVINKYHKELEHMARYDDLTELLNRRSFMEKIEPHISLYRRYKRPFSLLFLDIDDFKNINDAMGHQTGDQILIRIAKRLKEALRASDMIVRWGGEEFVVALLDTSKHEAEQTAQKLSQMIAQDRFIEHLIHQPLTMSIGVAEIEEEDSLDRLISRADTAMYQAKKEGKNRITVL